MLTKLVDYEYYSKIYGGSSIPESSFENLSVRAGAYINKYTYNRINDDNISEKVKDCTCEIAEFLHSQDKKIKSIENDKIVASETVGPHSKTYVNNTSLLDKHIYTDEEVDKKTYKICYKHLVSTGLMYRGF